MANQQDDDNNSVDYINETNEKSKETGQKAAETTAKVAKSAVKNSEKIAQAIAKIAASAPILIYVLIIVVIILYIFALYGFLSSMPGMFIGKLKETGKSFWRNVVGFITGDFDYVDSEDVVKLAQYLQDQGYDVQGYGFADVEYKEGTESTTVKGATKQIETVIGVKYRRNYLHSYIAASEETYQLSKYSIWGDLQATGAKLRNDATKLAEFLGLGPFEQLPESPNAYSTGLLNIQGGEDGLAEIDREREQLVLYTDKILGFKFGNVFSYDLSGWTSMYGRPTELFIALHLATGMPDLTYEIATDKDFNTKVNINLQNVSVNYGENSQLQATTPSGQTYNQNDIESAYYSEVLRRVYEQYISETDAGKKQKLADLYTGLQEHQGNQQDMSNFLTELFKNKELLSNNYDISKSAKNALGVDSGASSKMEPLYGNGATALSGVATGELQELAELANTAKEGIGRAKLPYIASVTNHWFYEDIQFTVGEGGVYKASKHATKDINYNGDGTALENYDVKIDNALLTDEDGTGIFYQVNEPYVHGPNEYIKKLFNENKFFKYDGTIDRAHAIAKMELLKYRHKSAGYKYIFNGEGWQLNIDDETTYDEKLPDKEKPRFGTPADTLGAFNILKQVHTEDSDAIYRMLKELVTSEAIEGHIEKGKLDEDLKQVLLWPFYTESDDKKWNVTKETNEYGISVKEVAGEQFIMPGDGTITNEDGKLVIVFDTLKSNPSKADPGTVEILTKKFVENDFYRINKDIVKGKKMIIEGVDCSSFGPIARGTIIGTAKDTVKIVMQYEDKSYIGQKIGEEEETIDDDVEDYMNQKYTIYTEEMVRKAIQGEKAIAQGGSIIPPGTEGNQQTNTGEDPGEDPSENPGENPGSDTPSTGSVIPEEQIGIDRDTIYAIVAKEVYTGPYCYRDALAVITCMVNRLGTPGFAGNDSLGNLIKQPGQWGYNYPQEKWKKYLDANGHYIGPSDVKNAVDDCLDKGMRTPHGFTFYISGENNIRDIKNGIMNQHGNVNLDDYCKNIGGNLFYNRVNGKYLKEYENVVGG